MFLKDLFLNTVNNSWRDLLIDEFEKDYMINLSSKLQKDYDVFNIYPKKNNIFKSLAVVDLPNIRTVVIGQD